METAGKIVYQGGCGEITEKKSRFIATVFPVSSEEEAVTAIEKVKKKYYDARHNCYAYVIGGTQKMSRCSDDGEPSGTAGRPILEVIQGEDIRNILIIVTRYFGGTLLGTGGLVRAYTQAAQAGIEASVIADRKQGIKYNIHTDYNGIGKLQYLAGNMGIPILDTIYTEAVRMLLLVPASDKEAFEKQVTEATAGRAQMEIAGEVLYACIEKEVVLFE